MTPAIETPKKRFICVLFNGQAPAIRIQADTICKEKQPNSYWSFTFKRGDEVVGEIMTKTPSWWVEEAD
jgi:hypothetical protein